MNLGDFHYDRCTPDYPSKPIICDSHSNISISAVISSSCVVLEGLRDSSDCLSSVFPAGQDGQAFFAPEFHSSLPTSVMPSDVVMFPNSAGRFSTSNSLECPSVSHTYGNHFFESAATEFTSPGDELDESVDTTNVNNSFLTEDEADGAMTNRSHGGSTFVGISSEEGILPMSAVFTRGHRFIDNDGFEFYSSEEAAGNDCRFGASEGDTFHSSNLPADQIEGSACQHSLLTKTSPVYQADNNAPFSAFERVDHIRDVDYSSNDSCIQNQINSPSAARSQVPNFQSDDPDRRTGHLDLNALQTRSHFPLRNNTNCFSSNSTSQPSCIVSFTMNASFNPVSAVPDDDDNVCDSMSNSDCVYTDPCKQFPCGSDTKINTTEYNKYDKYSSSDSLCTEQRQSILHKYQPGSDAEYPSIRHYSDQKMQISDCLYAKGPASVAENVELLSSPSSISYDDEGRGNEDLDNRNAEKPTRIVGAGKPKRKHAETVESLQQHLETLDDRRKNMALSCSYLSLLRQRNQGTEDKSGDEQSGTGVIDVDHMMCSGVTVAGFKPRAIIRKRRKTATPTDVKDTEYWQKRRKNNDSARKSRESKKEKEKNFYKRALELEYENIYLQECLSLAENELASLGHPFVPPVFGGQYYY